MTRPRTTTLLLAALCAAAWLASAECANTTQDVFSDYVDVDGEKMEVADPMGDPTESDSVEQDQTAEWQLDMVKGLLKQRMAEKDFINKLVIGGKTLNALVNNITSAFTQLESARQQKGVKLIQEHFESEVNLLKKSQEKVLSDLEKVLAVQSGDSESVKSLKKEAVEIVTKNFKQQIAEEASLFKRQLSQIQKEHIQQIADVKKLFALINEWRTTFKTGLIKSQNKLKSIAQSWDML